MFDLWKVMNRLLCIIFLFFCSCSPRETGVHTFQSANKLSLGIPANSTMSMGVVPTINAKTISKEHLEELKKNKAPEHGSVFDSLYYMGSKSGFHYFMHCPAIKFRNMYRVSEKEYIMTDVFALTTDSSIWRSENQRLWPFAPYDLQIGGVDFGGNMVYVRVSSGNNQNIVSDNLFRLQYR